MSGAQHVDGLASPDLEVEIAATLANAYSELPRSYIKSSAMDHTQIDIDIPV